MSEPVRRKVEKGIYRWPNGRWELFVRAGGQPLSHHWLKADKTLTDARDWRADERRRLLKLKASPGVADCLEVDVRAFLKTIAHNKELHAERKHQLGLWCEHFGQRKRDTISTTEIDGVLSGWLAAGDAASTVIHRRMALVRLYTVLDRRSYNPAKDSARPETAEPDARGIPFWQVQRILDGYSDQGGVFRKGKGGRRPHSLARARAFVLAHTALRPEELMRSAPSDWNPLNQTLYVHAAKGSNSRTIKLVPAATAALEHFAACDAWGTFSGSTFNRSFWRAVDNAIAIAAAGEPAADGKPGVEGFKLELPADLTPYVLRHSFATDLYLECGDLGTVQNYLGHRDIRMTMRYAKGAINAVAAAAVDKLGTSRVAKTRGYLMIGKISA
jgi:integrase/recombinase XerD